ncbi:RYamide receptor-like [Uranotaenia lowii]|uniref:RYamide receptor-like n=1 Tax=Uranotaenia lowii TaxID=190385 RepID=UPI002479ACB2|nr:RYamide receptor-like [Uranotaenia lowii]
MFNWPNETIDGTDPFNCTTNTSVPDAIASPEFQTLIFFAYSLIFLIAVIGNLAVFLAVTLLPRMQTVTNFFIANLALGDMLMAVFCIPFSFVSILILQYWPFGTPLCHLVNYSQAISVLVSAYTMIVISADRFLAIMWPLKPRFSKRTAKISILLIWIGALLTAAPILVFTSLIQPTEYHDQCDLAICTEVWPDEHSDWLYSIILITLQFIVPLIVLIFTYALIARKIWAKTPLGESIKQRERQILHSKRKIIKMMITVVLVFIVCWLPFNIFMLLPLHPDWPPLPYLWFLVHWLAMSHSCYNPLIYCFMNEKFRQGFQHLAMAGVGRCCPWALVVARRRKRSTGSNVTEMLELYPPSETNTMLSYVSEGGFDQ